MQSPQLDESHPDYQIACEEALDMTMRSVVDAAILAGWKPETVFSALASVAESQRIAYNEDPDPADD